MCPDRISATVQQAMRPKILLTGKSGQIGRELNELLPHLGDLVALDRTQLDLNKPDEIRQTIRSIRPGLIVNAAAYTAVDQAETDETAAQAANADAPGLMAEEARRIGAAMVHYSTDYVFDGSKTTPYVETDPTNPINVYGRTKLAGEGAIRENGVPYVIFRTAWVYAHEGKNFLLTVLRLATQREELRIVRDQIGAPTWSREIALTTYRALSTIYGPRQGSVSFSEISGIYHMTAAGETSWYEFAATIVEECQHLKNSSQWVAAATSRRPLVVRRIIPITTSEYPTPARRPLYSVLSNARLAVVFGTQLPDWKTQLRSLFSKR
jgi:dTDP-4-dehydrorhamnose reductase